MTRLLHPFEDAGLGLAPFRCTDMTQRRVPGSGQPAGTCDFCGNGILFCFHVESSDGKKFIVGSDCVLRTGTEVDDQGMTLEVRRLVAAERREKANARRQVVYGRAKAARALLAEHPALLANEPHPFEYYARQGLRLRDYYDYLLKTTWGEAGLRRICKVIEQAHAAALTTVEG